jgi:hypothetical protein
MQMSHLRFHWYLQKNEQSFKMNDFPSAVIDAVNQANVIVLGMFIMFICASNVTRLKKMRAGSPIS